VQEISKSSSSERENEGNKKYDDNLGSNIVCEEEAPSTEMTFSSEAEVTLYYMNYARRMGFGMSKISSKNGDDGKKNILL
jgi:hypothetical protein